MDAVHPRPATLTFIDNAVDSLTGTIQLKAQFTNADRVLWPGALVRVVLELDVRRGALVVPMSAVVNSQQGSTIYIVGADHKVTIHPVKVEQTSDSLAVLAGGVEAGDTVVTDGQLRLTEGARVAPQYDASSRRPAVNIAEPFIRAAGHDHPGHVRHPDLRAGRLPPAAGERPAHGRLPDHHGLGQPAGRQPRDDGRPRWRLRSKSSSPPSPGSTSSPPPASRADPAHPAVHAGPRHRRRRGRRAGRHHPDQPDPAAGTSSARRTRRWTRRRRRFSSTP